MINVLPYSVMKKLNKTKQDVILCGITMSSFVDEKSSMKGVLSLEVTVTNLSHMTTLFVVESRVNYNVLLGCDWIYKTCCISSLLYPFVLFWTKTWLEYIQPTQGYLRPTVCKQESTTMTLDASPWRGTKSMASVKKYHGARPENFHEDSEQEVLIDLFNINDKWHRYQRSGGNDGRKLDGANADPLDRGITTADLGDKYDRIFVGGRRWLSFNHRQPWSSLGLDER